MEGRAENPTELSSLTLEAGSALNYTGIKSGGANMRFSLGYSAYSRANLMLYGGSLTPTPSSGVSL